MKLRTDSADLDELLFAATLARQSGFARVEIDPKTVCDLILDFIELRKFAVPGEADLPSDLDTSGLISDEEPQLSAARDTREAT